MKIFTKLSVITVAVSTLTISCSVDKDVVIDDTIKKIEDIETGISVPSTYEFTRNNESTVSYSGQTTRLSMAKEILGYFSVQSDKSVSAIEAAFAHTAGASDFSTSELNDSSKSVKSKVAASDDLFGNDAVTKAAIQSVFSGYISKQVTEVRPNLETMAVAGTAGYIGTKPRYVNAKGLEYDQAFNKGLIGALILDQVLNNYLGNTRVDNEEYKSKNTAGTLEEGKNYTKYEHHFDEAYGYVYGDESVDGTSPVTAESDKFLLKYITRVNGDTDFVGIQEQIFQAFKLGRAAVVAKDYDVLEKSIKLLQYQISKVIGVRAVYYLQAGKKALAAQNYESGFHDLSEGYGFVYSLQFTRNPETDAPYFTNAEVKAMIAKLEAGNGFWDLVDGTVLDELSNTISAKFDFTTAQAAE